ncbi:MAG: hypothetical protein IT289_13240 [Oligoflexia bacterium]|nr:hypothetical protein [Oligoflexia bacterium]
METKTLETALLATFLNDAEFQNLAKNSDFQSHVVAQKDLISRLLKSSYSLKFDSDSSSPNVQSARQATKIPESPKSIEPTESPLSTSNAIDRNQNHRPTKESAGQTGIVNEIIEIFAEKTGYPSDMLDPQLDLEADLGIDTIKQMEILAIIRTRYGIEKQENFSLKQTPSIASIIDLVNKRRTA